VVLTPFCQHRPLYGNAYQKSILLASSISEYVLFILPPYFLYEERHQLIQEPNFCCEIYSFLRIVLELNAEYCYGVAARPCFLLPRESNKY
jgi:hypothetical protein